MMDLKFKWAPGDIVRIEGGGNSEHYHVVLGTTMIEEGHRYPGYITKNFGMSKKGKFVGYHTKAYKTTAAPAVLWFEGMQYLWSVQKISFDNLTSIQRKAYETAMKDVKSTKRFERSYYISQIIFIFREARHKGSG